MANNGQKRCPVCARMVAGATIEAHKNGCFRGMMRLQVQMGLITPEHAAEQIEERERHLPLKV